MKIVHICIFFPHISTGHEYGFAVLFQTYPQSSGSKHIPLKIYWCEDRHFVKISWCQIFVGSLIDKNLAPQKFKTL